MRAGGWREAVAAPSQRARGPLPRSSTAGTCVWPGWGRRPRASASRVPERQPLPPAPRLPPGTHTPAACRGASARPAPPRPGQRLSLPSGGLAVRQPQAGATLPGCGFGSGRGSVELAWCLRGRCGLAGGMAARKAQPGRAGGTRAAVPAPASLLGHWQRQDPGGTAQPWKWECEEEKWLKAQHPADRMRRKGFLQPLTASQRGPGAWARSATGRNTPGPGGAGRALLRQRPAVGNGRDRERGRFPRKSAADAAQPPEKPPVTGRRSERRPAAVTRPSASPPPTSGLSGRCRPIPGVRPPRTSPRERIKPPC